MKKVSVTTLEKFRRYMTEASSFDTEESLIESISGIFKGNDKTKFGSAYHKIIEGDYLWEGTMVRVYTDDKDEFLFNADHVAPAIEFRAEHKKVTHEFKATKIFPTAYGPVQVVGKVDLLEGLHVRDEKCKFRSVKWQEYIDSCQWKYYLIMFGADVFWYDLYEVQGFKCLENVGPYVISKDVVIIGHEPLKCDRYPEMENECQTILNDFMDYIDAKGFHYLLQEAHEEHSELNF